MLDTPSLAALLPDLHDIACEAATAIMEVYASDFVTTIKADHSPVTAADQRANDLIVARLAALTPHIPIVSEEGAQPKIAPDAPFWLVDPLDGTRSFVARDGQFTVNIALIVDSIPRIGVIQLPAHGTLYWGLRGEGAWRSNGPEGFATGGEPQRLMTREPSLVEGYDIVASKSYATAQTDAWLRRYPVRRRVQAGSSLKFCRVAEGAADIYPRLGRTMEWDTAAGQCILEAAGGCVVDAAGNPLRYGKPGYLNAAFFASGKPLVL